MFNKIRSIRFRAIRKRWFVAAAAVALLAVGLTFGSALAAGIASGKAYGPGYGYGGYDAERRGGDSDAKSAILARAAEIVGVTPAALEAAFVTAHNEAQTASFNERVGGMVEAGDLTQEQADAATAWFASRPDAAGPVAYYIAKGADADRVAAKLERMVTAGYITQEQSDAITTWQSQRPEGLPTLSGGHDDDGRGHRDGGRHDRDH